MSIPTPSARHIVHSDFSTAIRAISRSKSRREKSLYDEYTQRLNVGINDIHRILNEQAINQRQLRALNTDLAEMEKTAAQAGRCISRRHNIDILNYAGVHGLYFAKQIEQINLQQAVMDQRVALQSLLGGPLPLRLTSLP